MDTRALFLNTLADVERRIQSYEPYEILMISALLRKLFLDDYPLVDQVNKVHKLKFGFETTVTGDPRNEAIPPVVWSVQDGLDPYTAPPFFQRQTLGRDAFFKTPVALAGGHLYTVKDVILFEANVIGGVHAGAAKTDKEKALHEVQSVLFFGGADAPLRQLLAIARVALRALAPLKAEVLNEG